MRCGTARKRISDEIDGALPLRCRLRLEAHLRACPACGAYREGLVRIQAAASLPPDPPPDFWFTFERKVDVKLAAAAAGRRSVEIPFSARRRWAWGAAAALALAGAIVWYALIRQGTPETEAWIAYEGLLDPLVQAVEASPEVAGQVDREIRASIEEMAPAPDADAAVLAAADPLFWEGLSDDELRAVVSALEEETGHGGPL